jgi:hypothetical protein
VTLGHDEYLFIVGDVGVSFLDGVADNFRSTDLGDDDVYDLTILGSDDLDTDVNDFL